MPLGCPLVGNELVYVISKVCGSGTKLGVNTDCGVACLASVSITSLPVKPT